MATDTMPRTPGTIRRGPVPGRQPPGRTPAPGRTLPPGRRGSQSRPQGRLPGTPQRPVTAPRHTRPVAGPRAAPRHPRAPFLLLLVGLLGGALVTLLVISTTLAEGSYQITNLQQQNTNLARQEQVLTQAVAQAESPQQIAQEAAQFGMRQDPYLRFIDLKTGKIVTGKVPRSDADINIPGYTP